MIVVDPQPARGLTDVRDIVIADVRRAARGDRPAADRLVRRILPRVRNLVRYLAYSDCDVDDLAQDALVAILRGLPSYRAEGAFTSWCDRVTVRATFASLKSRWRAVQLDGGEAAERADAACEGGHEYVARRATVRALDHISVEQRHAIVLHYAVDMTVPEIAAEFGISAETVRSRLRLGKARLRELLGDRDRSEGEGEHVVPG